MSYPLDLHQTPYSCRGSYLALSYLNANHQGRGNAEGLHLRTIHNCAITPLIAQLDLHWNGTSAECTALLDDAALTLQCGDKKLEVCFADNRTLLFRGSPDCDLTLDFLTDNGPYDYIYPLLHERRTLYMANCYKNNCQYLIEGHGFFSCNVQLFDVDNIAFLNVVLLATSNDSCLHYLHLPFLL